MAEAKHAEKPAARVKMPEDFKPEENPMKGWDAIGEAPTRLGSAPYDGKPVQVLGREVSQYAEATWRLSRRWNNKAGTWEEFAYWAIHNGGGAKLAFVPTHWRKVALIAAGA